MSSRFEQFRAKQKTSRQTRSVYFGKSFPAGNSKPHLNLFSCRLPNFSKFHILEMRLSLPFCAQSRLTYILSASASVTKHVALLKRIAEVLHDIEVIISDEIRHVRCSTIPQVYNAPSFNCGESVFQWREFAFIYGNM